MPLYEYQCKKCSHKFERIRKFSDPPFKRCPQCGGTVEQLISSPAVQFKGSGWYVTDYGKKPSSGSSGSSNGDSGEKREGKGKEEKAKQDKPKEDKPKTESKKT